MTKRLNIVKLAKDNPKVDLKTYRKAVKAIRELRAMGIRPREYGLLSPYGCEPEGADVPNRTKVSTD